MSVENQADHEAKKPPQDPTKMFLWLLVPLGALFVLLLILGER